MVPLRVALLAIAGLLAAAVLSVATVGATQTQVAFTDLEGAFGHLGFDGPQVEQLTDLSVPISDPQRFRYATDFNGPATLDADWTRLTSHGAAEVEFGPDSLIGTGGFACNTLAEGYRTFCANDAPQTGVTYTAFYSTYADQFPVDDTGGLWVNLSWPTTIGDKETWQYQGQFVGDTWQGSSYIPYVTYGPDPWSLGVSRLEGGALVDVPDSQSFGLIGGDSSLMFVPTDELMQGNLTWDGFRFSYALHVHDSSFGACEDCTSVVTAYPGFPRDDLLTFEENPIIIGNGIRFDPSPTRSPTPTLTPTATEVGAGTGTTGSTVSDDGGGGISRVILILVTVAGVGLVVVGIIIIRGGRTRTRPMKPYTTKPFQTGTTRTREGQQQSSAPPPPPVDEQPSCSCTVSVAIEGATEFGVCCMQPKLSLNAVEDADATDSELDPSRIHLDADVEGKDDWDLFDSFYSATITADCHGGGEARIEDATYDWSVSAVDGGFELTCKVSVPVHCPDAVEHPPAEAEATLKVSYHSAPCVITVIVERTAWNEISHVDVQIVCGEYNEVFGYFPAGARTFAATIAGAPGEVIRTSTSRASQNPQGWTNDIKDEVGSDYSSSHSGKSLNVYFIEPDDCSVCEKLRDEWEKLSANPGEYSLLGNNCATQAYDTLVASGAVPVDFEGGPTTPTGVEDHLSDFRGAAAASGVTISEPTEIR